MRQVVGLAALVAALAGFGLDDARAQIMGGNQYSMAGCGLGTLIFQNDETKWKQVLSSTTNATFGTQTFGITFGTSNCNPGGGPTGRPAASLFIDVNREAFAKDVARGAGETIDHLAAILGCSDSTTVGRTLRDDFKLIFASEGRPSAEVTESVFESVRKNQSLASGCQRLG